MKPPGDAPLLAMAKDTLAASKAARRKISKKVVVYYGSKPKTAGMLFSNYANMVLNRNVDLFDDVLYLLEGGRLSSACIVARCVMETHAVGVFAWQELSKHVQKNGIEGAAEKVLKFINSSRFKVDEQKSLKSNKFSLDEYHFTDEAKERMLNEAAQSVHVMNAMRLLFSIDMEQSGLTESPLEILYNGLSEWVHPSQTSLLHRYAEVTQITETRYGGVSLKARMRFESAQGVALIQGTQALHNDMVKLGAQMHEMEQLTA